MIDELWSVPKVVQRDGDLRLFWLGAWAEASNTSFDASVADVLHEMWGDVSRLEAFDGGTLAEVYPSAIDALGHGPG
jgi:hypothetical protein